MSKKPAFFGAIVAPKEPTECGRCHHVAGYFINVNGVTLCPACPELRKEEK